MRFFVCTRRSIALYLKSFSLTGFAFAVLFYLATPATAKWSNDPAVNNPITTAPHEQDWPIICEDGAGGAFIAWTDYRNGVDSDVYAQHIDADGVAQWEFNGEAVTTAPGYQFANAITTDQHGGAIVAWADYGTNIITSINICAQRYDAVGVPQWQSGGVPINNIGTYVFGPVITGDGWGGVIVAWADSRSPASIYAQRISFDGTPQWTWISNGIPVCPIHNIGQMDIVSDRNGGAIIGFYGEQPDRTQGIFAQRMDPQGLPLWSTNGNTVSTHPGNFAIASYNNGDTVFAWDDARDTSGTDVYAQRLDLDGVPQWTLDGEAVCTATRNQSQVRAVNDGADGVIIVWHDERAYYSRVYAQRIASTGVPTWTLNGIPLSVTNENSDRHPNLVPDGKGGAIMAWMDNSSGTGLGFDLYAQHVTATGLTLWNVNGVPISTAPWNQSAPEMVSDGRGGAIACWPDARRGGPDGPDKNDIYATDIRIPIDLSPDGIAPVGSQEEWSPIGMNIPGFAFPDYDSNAQLYRASLASDPSRFRVTGLSSNRSNWLPYSSVSSESYVRAKFYVNAGADVSQLNSIPNLRLRLSNRFAVSSMLEVLHHSNNDPSNEPVSEELRPSTYATSPSIYRVDFDPVDVPYLRNAATTEGIMAAFEGYALDPQDNGFIALSEVTLGTYLANLIPDSVDPTKSYIAGTVDAGDLKVFDSATDLRIASLIPGAEPGQFATDDTSPGVQLPTYTELIEEGGITFDSTNVATNRIGLVAREFFPGSDNTQRIRVEEGKQYKVRFHVTSTQQSNRNAQMRLRAHAIKFAWSNKLEVGGSQATGGLTPGANNLIAQQALPGIGCLNPDQRTPGENGGWYTILVNSPMNVDIRADQTGPLSTRMPNISAQPGPGSASASVRDLKVGMDLIDTISNGAGRDLEKGNFTLDRIEVRTYPVVSD